MLNLSHKHLDVYQNAFKLLVQVYNLTKQFPKEEQFILTQQLKRASISICSNIAEGAARKSRPEKKRFFEVARSSAVEVDTQMEIALTLEYVNREQIKQLEQYLESCFKMLSKMISNIENNVSPPTSH